MHIVWLYKLSNHVVIAAAVVVVVRTEPRSSVGSLQDLRKEVAGSIPFRSSFRGLMMVIATGFIPLSPRCPLFRQRLCGKASNGLDRILCRVLVHTIQSFNQTRQCRNLTHWRYIAVENIARKGEIACNKCTWKCRLQFVSIWSSLKFCRLVRG